MPARSSAKRMSCLLLLASAAVAWAPGLAPAAPKPSKGLVRHPDAKLLLDYQQRVLLRLHGPMSPLAAPIEVVQTSGDDAFQLHPAPAQARADAEIRAHNGAEMRSLNARDLRTHGFAEPKRVAEMLADRVISLAGVPRQGAAPKVLAAARAVLKQRVEDVEQLVSILAEPRSSTAVDDLVYRAMQRGISDGRLDARMPRMSALGRIEILRIAGKGGLALAAVRASDGIEYRLLFNPDVSRWHNMEEWRFVELGDLSSLGITSKESLEAAVRIAKDKL